MRIARFVPVAGLTLFLASMQLCSQPPGELKYTDSVVGRGDMAVKGARVQVHYTGWLYRDGRRGKKFDSSLDRNTPFPFLLGAGEVIEGWDRGIEGMRVGGKREIIIPPHLGYGERGAPPDIPPNATLDFEVQLLSVQKAGDSAPKS